MQEHIDEIENLYSDLYSLAASLGRQIRCLKEHLEKLTLNAAHLPNGAELDIQPVSCSHCRLRKNCEFAFGSQCEDYERQPS